MDVTSFMEKRLANIEIHQLKYIKNATEKLATLSNLVDLAV
jgi:hypothetical protein